MSTPVALVDIQKAKDHLRVNHDEFDDDIYAKIYQASHIVMLLQKFDEVPDEWYVEASPPLSPPVLSLPPNIEAMVLLILSDLYENREGSHANKWLANSGVLTPTVKDLAYLSGRTPTMS